MASSLSLPSAVLATVMAVSGALFILSFHRQPANQNLRSCLLTGGDGRKKERKKKRVKFAEGVKDQTSNGEKYRKEKKRTNSSVLQRTCRGEVRRMPQNRLVLYGGIMKDSAVRQECAC